MRAIRDEVVQVLLDERDIDSIAVRPNVYQTSHRLLDIDVAYADGTFESLVLKDLGPRSRQRSARRVQPAFAHDPLREIDVYRGILSCAQLSTAAFRGAVVDPSRSRFWLVLEKVEARELWQHGPIETWCLVAAWLADMHAQLRVADSDHLVRWNADYVGGWISRARSFCDDPAVHVAARRCGELADRLLALPTGFVHGELYASNVLVDESSVRVCPIDWEMAGVGPLLLDLAALVSGAWSEEQRHEIVAAYWRRAPWATTFEELLADLDVCRLCVALQWLGWSDDWVPPFEHEHDWLSDVRMLIDKVGVA